MSSRSLYNAPDYQSSHITETINIFLDKIEKMGSDNASWSVRIASLVRTEAITEVEGQIMKDMLTYHFKENRRGLISEHITASQRRGYPKSDDIKSYLAAV